MHSKKKDKKVFKFVSENYVPNDKGSSSVGLYNSKSFFIRYYAYLPFIFALKKVNFNNNDKILDLGCSDGPFLPTLNKYGKKIIGIDINEELINKSKKLTKDLLLNSKKINLMASDGLALPFRDETFNIIFCLEVLEHVKKPRTIIKEIFRTLKNNGVFVCSIPVEIGPSLLIRELIGKIAKFNRPHYTKKELIRNAIFRKPNLRTSEMSHKNFDWRIINQEVKLVFKDLEIEFIPIRFFRDFNPIVLIKSIKGY